jgi:hypothetical protein
VCIFFSFSEQCTTDREILLGQITPENPLDLNFVSKSDLASCFRSFEVDTLTIYRIQSTENANKQATVFLQSLFLDCSILIRLTDDNLDYMVPVLQNVLLLLRFTDLSKKAGFSDLENRYLERLFAIHSTDSTWHLLSHTLSEYFGIPKAELMDVAFLQSGPVENWTIDKEITGRVGLTEIIFPNSAHLLKSIRSKLPSNTYGILHVHYIA